MVWVGGLFVGYYNGGWGVWGVCSGESNVFDKKDVRGEVFGGVYMFVL
jgi:hypothetical protein